MAKMNKKRAETIAQKEDLTAQKLPDGTRKYKMFRQDDQTSADAVALARYLLRFMDKNMLDVLNHEDKDEDGNVTGSEIAIYTRDDERGDIIFTIAATYLSSGDRKDESEEDGENDIREKNVSLNEGETPNNKEESI